MAANPAIWLSVNSETFRTIILWLAMRPVNTNCAVTIAWISLKLSSRECGQSMLQLHILREIQRVYLHYIASLSSLRFHIQRRPHRWDIISQARHLNEKSSGNETKWDTKMDFSNVHTKVIIIVLKLEKPSVPKRWECVLVLSNSINPWQWSFLCVLCVVHECMHVRKVSYVKVTSIISTSIVLFNSELYGWGDQLQLCSSCYPTYQ